MANGQGILRDTERESILVGGYGVDKVVSLNDHRITSRTLSSYVEIKCGILVRAQRVGELHHRRALQCQRLIRESARYRDL